MLNKILRILNYVMWTAVAVCISLFIGSIGWNIAYYHGKVSAETERLLFEKDFHEAMQAGTVFKWGQYRMVPLKSKTSNLKNVYISQVQHIPSENVE